MNKSESKYFNTAIKMDKAFMALLAQKDFEYITVKEICEKAGVNRSTFYLHYETIADLLSESVSYIYDNFLEYYPPEHKLPNIKNCDLKELLLVTPQYMIPYLTYIKNNKKLFRTFIKHSGVLKLENDYQKLFLNVFDPIMARFNVPASERKYIMIFYINGMIAVIMEWIKSDCKESIEYISDTIIRIVNKTLPPNSDKS